MLLTETIYYLENQAFGGATTRDMSLTEPCSYLRLYGSLRKRKRNPLKLLSSISFKKYFKFNPNSISNANSPAIFQKIPKGSKTFQKKQTQFKSSNDLLKSETNCNDVFLKIIKINCIKKRLA